MRVKSAMVQPPRVSAVIFDFDGVLADTEDLHYAAFQTVAAALGSTLSRDDYFHRYLGLPDRECVLALGTSAGRTLTPDESDALLARKRDAFARLAQDAQLYPGVASVLQRLQAHYTLAIASGAFRDEIEAVLQRAHVRHLFAAVVGAEDVRAGKPAPDPFLQALREINRNSTRVLTAADCVVIEDSPHGLAAARAAGMRCIAVTTSHDRAMLAGADATIDHVGRLRVEDLVVPCGGTHG